MDAATAYLSVAHGLPNSNFSFGYNDKPYHGSVSGVLPGYQNPQGYRVYPDTIFVGGFPSSTTERELRTFFETYGEVKDVKLPHDEKGMSKGYGFIKFGTEEMAGKILKAAESSEGKLDLNGRKINVARAMRRAQPPPFNPDYLLATPSGHLLAANTVGNPYLYSSLTLTPPPTINGNNVPQTQLQFYNMANGGVGTQQQTGQYDLGSLDGTPSMRTIQDTPNQSFEQFQNIVASAPSPSSYATAMMQQDSLNTTQQLLTKEQSLTPVTASSTSQFMLPQLSSCYAQVLPSTDMVHYSQMTSYPLFYALNNFPQCGLPGGFVLPMVQVPSASGGNSLEFSYQQNYNKCAPRTFASGDMHRTGFTRNGPIKPLGQNRCGPKNFSFPGGKKSPIKGTLRRPN